MNIETSVAIDKRNQKQKVMGNKITDISFSLHGCDMCEILSPLKIIVSPILSVSHGSCLFPCFALE